MKINTFLFIFISIFFISQIPSSNAWGEEGHSIVAALAQSMLTNRSLEWICFLEGNSTPSLVEICAAPDAYDNTPEGYWSGPLHFVNLPFLADRFQFFRDCGKSVNFQCVVSAILNFTALLEDQVFTDTPNRNPVTTPEPSPLAFIVHLLGDIHQRMFFFNFIFFQSINNQFIYYFFLFSATCELWM